MSPLMDAKALIVIRTKNEEQYLGDTLDAVFDQDERDFQVVIVDSGSTDSTLSIARRYHADILEIKPEEFTYGSALNRGISRASSEFVVCLSAHATPVDECWLSFLLKGFRNPRVAGVYGRQVPRSNANPLELLGMRISGVTSSKPRWQRYNMHFSNANGAIRRHLWELCPFDESLAYAEDFAWARQMQRWDYLIAYEPQAAAYHSHGEPFLKLLRRQLRAEPGKLRASFRLGQPRLRKARRVWGTEQKRGA